MVGKIVFVIISGKITWNLILVYRDWNLDSRKMKKKNKTKQQLS